MEGRVMSKYLVTGWNRTLLLREEVEDDQTVAVVETDIVGIQVQELSYRPEFILRKSESQQKLDGEGVKSPFDIFNREDHIWELIFNFLTDSRDLYNCSLACPEFQQILESKRATYLLPEVFSILSKKNFIDKHTLLECRKVSKTWKSSVDLHFERDFKSNETETNDFYNFANVADIEKFMEIMADHPSTANPFITRSITLREDNVEGQPRWAMFRALKNVLQKFGEHISHCEFSPVFPTVLVKLQEECYVYLCGFLSLMPNLQTLKIYGLYIYGLDLALKKLSLEGCVGLLETVERTRGETWSAPLKSLIERAPLPTMEHLKEIRVYSDCLSELVLIELIGKCPNLTLMEGGGGEGLATGVGILKDLCFPQNTDGSVVHGDLEIFQGCFTKTSELLTMNLFVWPKIRLIHLCLFGPEAGDETISVEDVFKVLEQFQDSLQVADLDFMFAPPVQKGSKKHKLQQVTLNLPRLVTFCLLFKPTPPIPLDFLLGVKDSLEFFSLILTGDPAVDSTEETSLEKCGDKDSKIKIYSCWNKMYESNIWKLFPQLKEITCIHYCLGSTSYKRGKYEKMMAAVTVVEEKQPEGSENLVMNDKAKCSEKEPTTSKKSPV